MNTFIKEQSKPSGLLKTLGSLTFGALLVQFVLLGVFGIGEMGVKKAHAQAATSTLTVTKVVDGGDAVAADFDLFVTSDTGTTTPVMSGVEASFEAGTYTVTETNLPGYTATFSGDCAADGSITLTAGADAECTITNTFDDVDLGATLTVTKVVEGGDMLAEEFELFVNATPVTSGVPLVFATGTVPTAPLTVSETPVTGYTATFSGDCAADGTVTLSEGMDAECTITNTFEAPTATTTSLTVTKVVEGGGELTAEDFPLFVNGMPITSGVATTTLALGTYTITETSTEDYTATFSGDCAADGTMTLVLGMDAECTITNTLIDPAATTTSLTVTKVVNGGNMSVADFPLFVNGMPITSGVATTTLALGTYFITENGNANYSATFSGDCAANGAVTLTLGVDAECTLTNTFVGSTGGGSVGDDDDDDNITIRVEGSSSSASGGEVNINMDGNTPFFAPFPGQVLGAQSYLPPVVPAAFPGQVLGAQSYLPGLPTTGVEPLSLSGGSTSSMPNGFLVGIASLLGMVGAGLILTPRSSSLRGGRSRGEI